MGLTTTRAACLLVLAILVGCKQSTTVNGRVSCDGEPLKKGSILFQPADGNGPSCGGRIVDGQYRLEVAPGAKKVLITAVTTKRYNLKNPQEVGFAKAAAARGDTSGEYECADPTVDTAEGNRAAVEVKPGSQMVDFALKRTAANVLKKTQ